MLNLYTRLLLLDEDLQDVLKSIKKKKNAHLLLQVRQLSEALGVPKTTIHRRLQRYDVFPEVKRSICKSLKTLETSGTEAVEK